MGSTFQTGRISVRMGCASSYRLPEQTVKVSRHITQLANDRSPSQAITIPPLNLFERPRLFKTDPKSILLGRKQSYAITGCQKERA
ncbi:hypothetical protein [Absidia glauca]|uniref:Uncharacterized protein n=1 Tax=Absidia glauca TaxID=4829 RepID=A0A168RKJ8_ABSGL|nr:hypothetical protein [Absidia glauca]